MRLLLRMRITMQGRLPSALSFYSPISIWIIAANAGLVMNTPIVTPAIVVSANPFNSPAPANINGIIATTVVKYAAMIMKNALFSLWAQPPKWPASFLSVSSVMTI